MPETHFAGAFFLPFRAFVGLGSITRRRADRGANSKGPLLLIFYLRDFDFGFLSNRAYRRRFIQVAAARVKRECNTRAVNNLTDVEKTNLSSRKIICVSKVNPDEVPEKKDNSMI